ncbi:MAG: V-type ATPase subunit [Treponema sp.]|jgi:vacuolar-type H+-ATPase subunit C/Vma6|nr:V-type ATPase subunit [Treponema sp.]
MPNGGERAYAYAKACGIIGKSFVGKRITALGEVNRLSDLDRIVFPAGGQDLPERELLGSLEDRLVKRAVKSIISILECFSKPPELLTLLLRSYEIGDLKNALSASLAGMTEAPVFTDLGPFSHVHFDAWPDIPRMIGDTEFRFLLDKNEVLYRELGGVSLQTVLDRYYYKSLWNSLSELRREDRMTAETILQDEIALRNAGWALRLRTYYWMSPEEVRLHLIYLPGAGVSPDGEDPPPEEEGHGKKGKANKGKVSKAKLMFHHRTKNSSLAADALGSLDLPLDDRTAWQSWRWARFLNPEAPGESWHVDPRFFQNAASGYLYRLAQHSFRLHPFSVDTIFCFIKLKLFEEDLLTSDAEGLGLGMSGQAVFDLLEVRP